METKITYEQQTFQAENDIKTLQSQYTHEEQQKIIKLFELFIEIDKSMKKKNENDK